MTTKKDIFRQVEIRCECGNLLSATVFANIDFDLTCIQCGNTFREGAGKCWLVKLDTLTEWPCKDSNRKTEDV